MGHPVRHRPPPLSQSGESLDATGAGSVRRSTTSSIVRYGAPLAGGALLIMVSALWWSQSQTQDSKPLFISDDLSSAESYKSRPSEDRARRFEGEGDVSFAASDGNAPSGRIDPSRVAEKPLSLTNAEPLADAETLADANASDGDVATSDSPIEQGLDSRQEDSLASVANPPIRSIPADSSGELSAPAMIQLGAFGSRDRAAKAWQSLSTRFAYLAALPMSISSVSRAEDTIYRLRATAGNADEAAALCHRLQQSGENCLVVR